MAGLLRRYKSPLYGNYRKYSLLYGAVSGAVLFVFVVVSYLAGSPISTPETYGTDAVLAVCIFVSSYLYRERQTGGKIFLKELLVLGMGIGVVAGADGVDVVLLHVDNVILSIFVTNSTTIKC